MEGGREHPLQQPKSVLAWKRYKWNGDYFKNNTILICEKSGSERCFGDAFKFNTPEEALTFYFKSSHAKSNT